MMAIARWNRLLTASAVCLAGARCLLVPAYGQGVHVGTSDPPPPRPCSQISADFITHLGVRYLNSGEPIPAAFNVHSANLDETDSARFRVYELTDDIRFLCDATSFFTDTHNAHHRSRSVTVRVHPAEPLTHGRIPVQMLNDPDGPYLQYVPIKRWGPRRETLRFTLHITKPNSGDYRANFDLTVPGLAGMLIPRQ